MPSSSCLVANRKTAFTMVELLAAIAIIALLVAVMVPAIGNYVETDRNTANKQTLTVLNDALTRYKTQGGDKSLLTEGMSTGTVLNLLSTPVSWVGGLTHQFWRGEEDVDPSLLKGIGSGGELKGRELKGRELKDDRGRS